MNHLDANNILQSFAKLNLYDAEKCEDIINGCFQTLLEEDLKSK